MNHALTMVMVMVMLRGIKLNIRKNNNNKIIMIREKKALINNTVKTHLILIFLLAIKKRYSFKVKFKDKTYSSLKKKINLEFIIDYDKLCIELKQIKIKFQYHLCYSPREPLLHSIKLPKEMLLMMMMNIVLMMMQIGYQIP